MLLLEEEKKLCLGQRFKAGSKISRCLETTESRPVSKLIFIYFTYTHEDTYSPEDRFCGHTTGLRFLLLLAATIQIAKSRDEEEDAVRLVPLYTNSVASF